MWGDVLVWRESSAQCLFAQCKTSLISSAAVPRAVTMVECVLSTVSQQGVLCQGHQGYQGIGKDTQRCMPCSVLYRLF